MIQEQAKTEKPRPENRGHANRTHERGAVTWKGRASPSSDPIPYEEPMETLEAVAAGQRGTIPRSGNAVAWQSA